MAGVHVLLLSTYESGHQPLGLAAPAAALRARGLAVTCRDLSVERLPSAEVDAAGLVAISVPMHTAARLGIEVARTIRRRRPGVPIAFYGVYASPLDAVLRAGGLADAVIGGEYERGLCALADSLAGSAGVTAIEGDGPSPWLGRQEYPIPDREGLPPLEHYARLDAGGELQIAGYVEASRGCAHTCTHCVLTGVYGGRLRLVPPDVVLADIDAQVERGARHITFGDPDFLNAVPHSVGILEAAAGRHPGLTFDVTAKVEHLLAHEALLPRLRELGCIFVTSAFESIDQELLDRLGKGHTVAGMEHLLAAAERSGLPVRPTWMAFTPWTTPAAYVGMLDFIAAHGLAAHVAPVQLGLRLLLPPGSPLVAAAAADGLLGAFDEEALSYAWRNPHGGMDALQAEIAAMAASGNRADPATVLAAAREAAGRMAGVPASPVAPPVPPPGHVPGLTEDWFC